MNKDRQRGVRGKAHPLNLTERDRDLLVLVGSCRYLSTTQVAGELFPSADRCRRRLRQLYDAGLLRVTLAGSTVPNLLSLTSAGVGVVRERDPELAATLNLPGAIALSGVRHHLGIVDVRLYLTALAAMRGHRLRRWTGGGGAFARELDLPHFGLTPDGLAELEVGGRSWRLAVEVDCGTETRRVLATKLAHYVAVFEAELDVGELWVLVDAGAARERLLHELVLAAGLGERTRLMPLQHCQARPVRPPLGRAAGVGLNRPNPEQAEMRDHLANRGVGKHEADVAGRAVRRADGRG